MNELPLVFLGGLLGSSHCIGMCGGFALTVGLGARGWTGNLGRQVVYSVGRIFTYAFGGAVAGFAGWRLTQTDLPLIGVQAGLSILAGALLVWQGSAAAGLRLRRRGAAGTGGCLAQSAFATFLRSPGWHNVFLAGVLTGFLPCGLVYAFLALATSSGNLLTGLTTMAVFGAGTVPVMVATGAGASLLSLAARKWLFRVAAACVVVTGLLSIGRGAAFLIEPDPAACPLCREREAATSDSVGDPLNDASAGR
jgi:sulfite exporter TauE/SafE